MSDATETFVVDDPYVFGRPDATQPGQDTASRPRPAWTSPRDWWMSADGDLRAIVVVVGVDALAVVVMLTTFLATLVPHFD